MTNGLIRAHHLKTFRYASAKAIQELTDSQDKTSSLWTTDPSGYQVHDYLDWNMSAEEEQLKRAATKLRVRAHRLRTLESHKTTVSNELLTQPLTPLVLGRGDLSISGKERESERKPTTTAGDTIENRAGRLVERYQELFQEHRHGARYRVKPNLDWHEAISLCQTWDDERLEKLAVLVLTTNDEWVSRTDRGFKIFALKASWADGLLTAWERDRERA